MIARAQKLATRIIDAAPWITLGVAIGTALAALFQIGGRL